MLSTPTSPTETLPLPKRRRRTKLERRQIVEETFAPGASVARVARAHGVNANQVFQWRTLYKRGLLEPAPPSTAALLPVRITASDPSRVSSSQETDASKPAGVRTPAIAAPGATPGAIEVELRNARLRIEGAADPASLRVILESLLG